MRPADRPVLIRESCAAMLSSTVVLATLSLIMMLLAMAMVKPDMESTNFRQRRSIARSLSLCYGHNIRRLSSKTYDVIHGF